MFNFMLRMMSCFSSYKYVLIIYSVLFFCLTSPFLLLGEVVSPYSQCIEFGYANPCIDPTRIEHRGLTDHPAFYIPEVYQHLNGARSGWLALWTKQNELGRPLSHLTGFSSAYLPSWIIAQFTDSPWRFITIFSLLTCFLAGIFIILFCREHRLSPWAGLIAGSSLAASPSFMFWLIFPMYLSAWCWAAGALLGITRIAQKSDLLGWSILTFSIYSLGMTAYPQFVVHHAYILIIYGLYLAYRKQQEFGLKKLKKPLLITVSAIMMGGVLVLPVHLDLAYIASESNQLKKGEAFFTMYLQGMGYWIDAMRFFVFITLPELFGNFGEGSYRFPYYGFSITILTIFCVLINLFTSFRRTWGWWIAVAIFVILTFSYTLYGFGIKYLIFNLSPVFPMNNITLPLVIIVAFGADKLLSDSKFEHRSRAVVGALIGVFVVIALSLAYGFFYDVKVRWGMALMLFVVFFLFATQIDKPRPIFMLLALIVVTATVSFPVMFRQSSASILKTSPLIDAIRIELANGGRYAISKPGLSLLPPNTNASLELVSVHNSNSLASRRYQTWLEAMGEDKEWRGGRNSSLSPDYGSVVFWMSNISLILSPTKLIHENLEYLREEAGVHLYKVVSRMGDSLLIDLAQVHIGKDGLYVTPPQTQSKHTSSTLLDQGDAMEFDVVTSAPSVLILSQKYHKDWQAQVLGQSGWTPAKTTVVNDVFQGILLPQDAQRVQIEFKPYVRFSWVAHVFWLVLLSLLGFNAWQKKYHSGGERVLLN
jgi:hypothetical protein